jgi:hypothetical protein
MSLGFGRKRNKGKCMARREGQDESDSESGRITKTGRFDADSWKKLERLSSARKMKPTEFLREVVDALVEERMVILDRLLPAARDEIRDYAADNRVDFSGAVFLMVVDALNRRREQQRAKKR